MKNKVIVYGLSLLAAYSPLSLQAAAEPAQKPALTAQQRQAAVALASAIYFNNSAGVEQIFNNNLSESLLVYENPSEGIMKTKKIIDSVHSALKTIFHDGSLNSLQNPAGIRFNSLITNINELIDPQQAADADKQSVQQTGKLSDLYTLIKQRPILEAIAVNIENYEDLAHFEEVSQNWCSIARSEFSRRTAGMWAEPRPIEGPIVIPAHEGQVLSVFVSDEGNIVSVGRKDGCINVWDGTTHKKIRHINSDTKSTVWYTAFSPTENILAVCHKDRTINVWNVQTEQKICSFISPCEVSNIALTSDGTKLAMSNYNCVRIWDVRTGTFMYKISRAMLDDNGETFSLVAFSSDGKRLAITGLWAYSAEVLVWDFEKSALIGKYQINGNQVLSLFPKDQLIVSSYNHDNLSVYDVQTDTEIAAFHRFDGDHFRFELYTASHDGALVAVVSEDKIFICNVKTSKFIRKFDKEKALNTMVFSLDGSMLVAGCGDGSIVVWKVTRGAR